MDTRSDTLSRLQQQRIENLAALYRRLQWHTSLRGACDRKSRTSSRDQERAWTPSARPPLHP